MNETSMAEALKSSRSTSSETTLHKSTAHDHVPGAPPTQEKASSISGGDTWNSYEKVELVWNICQFPTTSMLNKAHLS